MTSAVFFWYVLPWIITVVGAAWLAYDYYVAAPRRRQSEDHPHPGE